MKINSCSTTESKRGQVVIIVLLILVVVLTIGLSVATRTVTDIKTARQTELSNRAFNAAEAGIEAVLSGISPTGNITVGSGANQSNYNVSVNTVGGTGGEAFIFNKPVNKDDTQQIWLMGHKDDGSLDETNSQGKNFNSKDLYVYWGNTGQRSDVSGPSGITPAVEISVIYKDAAGYKIAKGLFDPNASRAASNNFSSTVDTAGNYTSSKLAFRKTVDLEQAPFGITGVGSTSKLYALRMRLLYNDAAQMMGAQPFNGTDMFPIQGKIISSTGNAGNVYRKVEVFESFPALPPIFDYVIFNGSNTSLGK